MRRLHANRGLFTLHVIKTSATMILIYTPVFGFGH